MNNSNSNSLCVVTLLEEEKKKKKKMMDETASEAPPTTTTTTPPTTEQQSQSTTTSSSSSSSSSSQQQQALPPPSVNPNPNPKPPNHLLHPPSLSRTPFNRPWPQNPPPPFPPPTSQRGGMAIGVPAPQPPSSSFASSSSPFSSSQVVRQSLSGMQAGMSIMGSTSTSSLRPTPASSLPHRPLQSSLRPQQSPPPASSNNHSTPAANFQDHSLLRLPSANSPAPNTPQNTQSHNQPWLSSGSQGKPPLPPPSFRPQMNPPQTLQQRSHMPPQQQSAMSPPTTQPPQTSSSLQSQSSSLSQQPQEHYSLPPSRVPQSLTHQQQMARNRGLGNQRPFAPALGPSNSTPVAPPPTFNRPPPVSESSEPCNRIISKRSIQEIVAQIDPAERLDPEVEDILVDIADDFVESVTTFACSLAKHRKSNTLESKDILLHLERNWNMSLPGFGGDEIKCYKKPFGNDVHRERVAAIKRSIAAAEAPNSKSSGGQAGGGAKGHPAKATALVIGSPNPKVRETT